MIDSDFSIGFKQGQEHGKQIMLEKIEDIKAEIKEVGYVKDEYGSIRADVLKVWQVLEIIDKHCGGENE